MSYANDGHARQERYISNEPTGLIGNLVAARCEQLSDPAERALIFWLQAMSHLPGGLIENVARPLMAQFPKMVCPHFGAGAIGAIEAELSRHCLDPKAKDMFCMGFRKLRECLPEIQKRFAAEASRKIAQTSIAKIVFEKMDYALAVGGFTIIEGSERLGKSTAARTWVEMRLGQARYVRVPSGTDKKGLLRAMARSFGLSSRYTFKAGELHDRIQDFVAEARVLVCLDEAHFLFAENSKGQVGRKCIDWVRTELVDAGVPVVLLATPQFTSALNQSRLKDNYSFGQLTGRYSDYVRLPDDLTREDLRAVAGVLLPECEARTIEKLVSAANLSRKYLPFMEFTVKRARYLAAQENREKPTHADVQKAIEHYMLPMENTLNAALSDAPRKQPARRDPRAPAIPAAAEAEPAQPPRINPTEAII